MSGGSYLCQSCQRGLITAMSRTQVRVVLILIAFILVMAAVLFGILTYWVGAEDLPASAPEGGKAGSILIGSRQREALVLPSLRSPFAVG